MSCPVWLQVSASEVFKEITLEMQVTQNVQQQLAQATNHIRLHKYPFRPVQTSDKNAWSAMIKTWYTELTKQFLDLQAGEKSWESAELAPCWWRCGFTLPLQSFPISIRNTHLSEIHIHERFYISYLQVKPCFTYRFLSCSSNIEEEYKGATDTSCQW